MAGTPSSSLAEQGMTTRSKLCGANKINEKHNQVQVVVDISDISSTTEDIQDCGENRSVIKIDLDLDLPSDFQKKEELNDKATADQEAFDKLTEEISDLETANKITGHPADIAVGSFAPDINTKDIWEESQLIATESYRTTEDSTQINNFTTTSTPEKEICSDHMSLHIIDLDTYDDGHSSDSSETKITGSTTQGTHYFDMHNGNNFCNALLISDDKGSDFHKSSPLVTKVNYQSYPHPVPISCTENLYSPHYDSLTVHENPQVIPYLGDQYENIEFSTIFSTLEDYHSFQENSMMSLDGLSQDNTRSESHENLIVDLDDETHKPLISDKGIFDISMTDFRPESLSSRDPQSDYCNEFSHVSYLIDGEVAMQKDNMTLKKEYDDSEYLQNDNYTNMHTNGDGPLQDYSYQPVSVQPHSHSQVFKTAESAATSLNMHNLALRSHLPNWTMQDSSVYDQYIKQCYGQCSTYNHLYHQGAPRGHFSPYTDWSPWPSGGHYEPCDTHPTTAFSRPSFDTWSVSAAWPKSEDPSPEIVQYSQPECSNEDEETDDADEPEGMPTFYESLSYMPDIRSPSSATPSSCSINSSGMIAYSPATSTPPSSASSTPGPSLSQGSYTSEEIGYYSPWPKPVCYLDNKNHVPSPIPMPSSMTPTNCKLSSDQLEATLLNYHAARRRFPSMADAMRNNRLSNKQNKRSDPDLNHVPRRLGRPRKNQIQSDKISTSTSKTGRGRQKSHTKSRGDKVDTGRTEPERNSEKDMNEPRSSSNSSQCGRHNEPLNQRAIEIMTKWYEDNIQNPYPNKSDKECMALEGGITENQVKSWFANKRNRSNNTKPKLQKRVMEQKLRELFQDLKHSHRNPSADNTHIIQQLSGIIKRCRSKEQE